MELQWMSIQNTQIQQQETQDKRECAIDNRKDPNDNFEIHSLIDELTLMTQQSKCNNRPRDKTKDMCDKIDSWRKTEDKDDDNRDEFLTKKIDPCR